MLDKDLLPDIEGLLDCDEWNDDHSAFIKQGECNGKPMWFVCSADGEKIAATDNREFAFIVAKQNDLDPFSVH